jgi:hypothetical protein
VRHAGSIADPRRRRAPGVTRSTGVDDVVRPLASERWRQLDAAGARPQPLLWASAGTKDPAVLASLVFAPKIALPAIRRMLIQHGCMTATGRMVPVASKGSLKAGIR